MTRGPGDGWRGDGVGDPAVLAAWSHGDQAWRGSGPGLAPHETGQLVLTTGTDEGRRFGLLQNRTEMVRDPAWSYRLQGPGRGIPMGDGRLVYPAQFQLSPDEGPTPHSTVQVSAHGGAKWRIGAGARSDTTESAVVGVADGELMPNMGDDSGGSRAVATSADGGATCTRPGLAVGPHPARRHGEPRPRGAGALRRGRPPPALPPSRRRRPSRTPEDHPLVRGWRADLVGGTLAAGRRGGVRRERLPGHDRRFHRRDPVRGQPGAHGVRADPPLGSVSLGSRWGPRCPALAG
jgi:hypothetical protein